MKIVDRFKEQFLNKNYYISFYSNHIYVINYKNIISFSDSIIKVEFNDFNILIKGRNFYITRKNDKELDIEGIFSSMEIINE
ncbi:MAG: YabP/YqfC family sporulation protein [Bacilli bacterium]|nr:YabP/YqfC family sporulation protein [Bacilli bacterium]